MDMKECANCGYKSETAFENDVCPECGRHSGSVRIAGIR